jgi:hypothetical protein
MVLKNGVIDVEFGLLFHRKHQNWHFEIEHIRFFFGKARLV